MTLQSKKAERDPLPQFMILLIGLPASGKSSFASILFQNLSKFYKQLDIVDIDSIRMNMMGSEFNPEMESLVIKEKDLKITTLLSNKSSVIVDDLHYFASMRHKYFEMASKFNVFYISIYFSTPLEVCLQWNRERKNPIPNTLIEKINEKFDIPGQKYEWDQPKFVYNAYLDDAKIIIQQIVSLLNVHSEISSKPRKNTSQNTATNKNDFESRQLINKIIKKEISTNIYEEIFNNVNKISKKSPKTIEFGLLLSKLRKKYLQWLNQNPQFKIDAESFLNFLKSCE